MSGGVTVRHICDGEYRVECGGDIYRRGSQGAHPYTVRKGDTASAAEICEWRELGVEVVEL